MPATFAADTALRVALYSQDGLGLGHMRRSSLVAQGLLAARPDAALLRVGDSPLGPFFAGSSRSAYLALPTIIKTGRNTWRPAADTEEIAGVLAARRRRIAAAMARFRPHLLLVDHMPQGARGELLPALELLDRRGDGGLAVLILRDILDAPEVIRSQWTRDEVYRTLEEHYDLVLVLGQREVFDVKAAYGLRSSPPLVYCGYLAAEAAPGRAAEARSDCFPGAGPNDRLLLAEAGGGADAYQMMHALLDALPAIRASRPVSTVLLTGPFLPADERRRLEEQARPLGVRVLAAVSDPLAHVQAADLVVAMAGYNTTGEVLRCDKPLLLVPRAGPSAEQGMRSRLFAARGWVDVIDPGDLSAGGLAEAILASLARGPSARRANGLRLGRPANLARHLLALVQRIPRTTPSESLPAAAWRDSSPLDADA